MYHDNQHHSIVLYQTDSTNVCVTNNKTSMDRIKRSLDDTRRGFIDKYERLKVECDNYDKGIEPLMQIEYMSASLRILLKDTRSCKSLLAQLNEKDNISFIDTSSQPNTISFWNFGNNISNLNVVVSSVYMGLLVKSVCLDETSHIHYQFKPILDKNRNAVTKSFGDWYNSEVYNDGTFSISRKKLIEIIAEQDGGVHVDSGIEKDYNIFKKKDSLKVRVNGDIAVFDNNPALVSLRQISYEVLASLENLYITCKNDINHYD